MRDSFLRRLAALAVLASLAGSTARAQKQPATVVRESASVSVVEIPVNVIGKDGKPVADLTANDFELFEDGKRQTISGFEVIDLRQAASPDSPPPSPAARRHWLLVFDLSFTSLSGLSRARQGAQAFVASAMKEGDLAAVGTLSVDTGWKLLVNFTADRRQLARAIDTLGFSSLAARSNDPLAFAFVPPRMIDEAPAASGRAQADLRPDWKELATMQKKETDAYSRGRATQLLRSLSAAGRALDAVRGRKHVLFFSEGFEARLLSGNSSLRSSISDGSSGLSSPTSTAGADAANFAISGEYWKIDSDTRFGSTTTQSILKQALGEFRRSDTELDTIDISGLRTEADVAGGLKPGSGAEALFAMASETSGEFIRNANQLDAEIERLVDRTNLIYLLAYQPKASGKPGTFHALQVKVNRSETQVRARAGYTEPRPFSALSPIERVLATGDLITGGLKENPFPVGVLVTSFAAGSGRAQVPVVLEIPGKPLLAADVGEKTGIQIFAYAMDSSGTLRDYLSQDVGLDLKKARTTIEANGLKFYGTLSLPAGDYSIRTLVRNATTGRSSVARTPVHVQEVPGSKPIVLPPFFQEPVGRWMMVRGASRSDASARPLEYPFSLGGEPFIPSALPILAPGATAQVAVITYNFGAGDRPEPLQVLPEIVGADGKPRKAEVQVARRFDTEHAGARAMLLSFAAAGLEPGRYVLKVRVSDRVSRRSAEAVSPFEVR